MCMFLYARPGTCLNFDLLKRGCANSVVGLELAEPPQPLGTWPKMPVMRGNHTHSQPQTSEHPWSRSRGEKSVHNHHRKKIFWETFLASKKNFPGRWWIQKPYKNQEHHIYHRNLSSVAPIFFGKEKFLTGAGRCMLSFRQGREDWEGDLHDNIKSGPGKPNQRKVSSWTFRRGIPEQKFNVNRACFPKENTRTHKKGRNSWTFRFGPFFGLVCWGDYTVIVCTNKSAPSEGHFQSLAPLLVHITCPLKDAVKHQGGINKHGTVQAEVKIPTTMARNRSDNALGRRRTQHHKVKRGKVPYIEMIHENFAKLDPGPTPPPVFQSLPNSFGNFL